MTTSSTTLGYAILGLIHEQPQSGYNLRKVFASTPMGHYSSSPGAIYPALRRLEEQGLIFGRVDRSKSLRPKQIFRPTVAGSRALEEWLTRPVTGDDVIWKMDELMLRFAFHSFLESDEATRSFLTSFIAELDAYVRALERQRKDLPDEVTRHGKLAIESGIESYRAHTRWARRALKEFSRRAR